MSRLVACVLLLSASSTAFLVSGATINKRPSFLRRATSAFLKEDPEIEKWAQDEAAKSVAELEQLAVGVRMSLLHGSRSTSSAVQRAYSGRASPA